MSCQKGNTHRTRPQKYQNRHVFKNDLHDKSKKTKAINSIQVCNVCERCKKIIEWKIKYKKFKPLKTLVKCIKCDQKVVKHAYHTMCGPCARERDVCPKCGDKAELVEGISSPEEQLKLDGELQAMLNELPERKRRTFIRYMNQKGKKKDSTKASAEKDIELKKNTESFDDKGNEENEKSMQEDLLAKLKSLSMKKKGDESDSDFDSSDDELE